MGMVLVRVPATDETKESYVARLNAWWRLVSGKDEDIASHPWAIQYTRVSDGVLFAAPGNGDVRITEADVLALAGETSSTQMQVQFRESIDPSEFERVTE